MLVSLIVPILVSAAAVFVASAVSWMIAGIHAGDWRKLPNEAAFMDAVRAAKPPVGNYMFPGMNSQKEAQTPEFQALRKAGPSGVVTVFPDFSMGRNLALTFLYFLAVAFCLAYLATLALDRGAEPMKVFRFIATAGLMTHFAAMVPHAIWFRCRIVSTLIDAVAFSAITGAIFAAFWPKA